MNHFSFVFKWYIEKDLNLKRLVFFVNQILADISRKQWKLQNTMLSYKYEGLG